MTIRVVSQNVPGRLSPKKRESIWRGHGWRGDLLMGQESLHSWRQGIFRRMVRWTTYVGQDEELPILWRTTALDLVHRRSKRAYGRSWVGAWGAGPSTMKPAVNNMVILREKKTKRSVAVINAHLVPSTTRPGKGPVAAIGRARRRALFKREVANILALTQEARAYFAQIGEPFRGILVGDFNASDSHPDLKPIWRAGFRNLVDFPTLGSTSIDKLWIAGAIDAKVTRGKDNGSDHRPIKAVVRLLRGVAE